MTLPRFEPFTIPALDLILVDFRSASLEDRRRANRILKRLVAADLLAPNRPGVRLCRVGVPGHCDYSLPTVTLCGYSGGRKVVGAFNLYNIRTREGPGVVQAAAMALPGLAPLGGLTLPATWAVVMRALLARDVLLSDARSFDLVTWDFPEPLEYRWKSGTRDEIADQVVGAVAQDNAETRRGARGELGPEKISRPGIVELAPAPSREV